MATGTVTEKITRADGSVAANLSVGIAVWPGPTAYAGDTLATVAGAISVQTAGTGIWTAHLEETNTILPAGTMYRRSYALDGIRVIDYFTVPGTGTYPFETVVQPAPSAIPMASAVTSLVAGTGIAITQVGSQATIAAAKNEYLSLPGGWDDHWRAARAASVSAPKHILFLGDSTGSGLGTSNIQTKPWPMIIRAALIAQYGLAGDYWPASYNVHIENTPPSVPFTINLTGGNAFAYGLGTTSYSWVAGSANNALVFDSANTPSPNCVKLELISMGLASGQTFSISLDGSGSPNVINTGPLNQLKKDNPWGTLASASHTLTLKAMSADNCNFFCGVNQWANPAAGIFFSHHTMSGNQLWNSYGYQYAAFPPDRCRGFQGPTGAGDNTTGFGYPVQPDLAVIALGINDMQTQRSPRTAASVLARICYAIRRGVPDASILIVAMPSPDPRSSDITSGFTDSQNWPAYVQALADVAVSFRAGFANMHTAISETPVADGLVQGASNAHPSDAGAALIASLLLPAMGGS